MTTIYVGVFGEDGVRVQIVWISLGIVSNVSFCYIFGLSTLHNTFEDWKSKSIVFLNCVEIEAAQNCNF
jgi:hypothetical protein